MKFFAFFLLMGCTTYYRGEPTTNFDGKRFFHPWPQAPKSIFTVLKWQWTSSPAKWPESLEQLPTAVFPKNLQPQQIAATFINHSSVFLQHKGNYFITDPHWSDRASPVSFAGPKRVRKPGAEIDSLPRLDYVMVSHNHYDHFDVPTLKKLDQLYKPLFLIPLGDAYLMKSAGIKNFKELNWYDEVELKNGVKAIFVPVKHWSARGLADRNRSLWGGFVILSETQKIFFGGDTGYCDTFSTLAKKYGPFTFSLIPIGAYEPRWFMKDSHMNPEESVQAHLDLKSKLSMGVHFGHWQLTDESINQPEIDLNEARKKFAVSAESFITVKPGETKIID